jgi:hypothetical protein
MARDARSVTERTGPCAVWRSELWFAPNGVFENSRFTTLRLGFGSPWTASRLKYAPSVLRRLQASLTYICQQDNLLTYAYDRPPAR